MALKKPTQKAVQTLQRTQFALQDDGFVRLVDHFGCDAGIVETARLTAQSAGRGREADRKLLRYLFRHRHSTPFEFAGLTLHVRVPMDTWRQWIRHRTASVNEYSTRYSPAINKAAAARGAWRRQSQSNRQGSSDEFVTLWPAEFWSAMSALNMDPQNPAERDRYIRTVIFSDMPQDFHEKFPADALTPATYLDMLEERAHRMSRDTYEEYLRFGVAKEQARKDLPLSTYTEAYWSCDLHNLMHFLGLRMDPHAQQEIREYAELIGEKIVAVLFPETWQAFLDYRLHALTLTRQEVAAVRQLVAYFSKTRTHTVRAQRARNKALRSIGNAHSRERAECVEKLCKLGFEELVRD